MTGPSVGQLQAAARRKLLAYAPFAALIGTDVGTDTGMETIYPGTPYADGWVFQGVGDDGRPQRDPTSTGTSAVCLLVREGWTGMNMHNTARFPSLRALIFSDLTRAADDNGMIAKRDAENRCSEVARIVIDCFHDPANRDHWWPNNVYVSSCVLNGELNIRESPKGDGLVVGSLTFALSTD